MRFSFRWPNPIFYRILQATRYLPSCPSTLNGFAQNYFDLLAFGRNVFLFAFVIFLRLKNRCRIGILKVLTLFWGVLAVLVRMGLAFQTCFGHFYAIKAPFLTEDSYFYHKTAVTPHFRPPTRPKYGNFPLICLKFGIYLSRFEHTSLVLGTLVAEDFHRDQNQYFGLLALFHGSEIFHTIQPFPYSIATFSIGSIFDYSFPFWPNCMILALFRALKPRNWAFRVDFEAEF